MDEMAQSLELRARVVLDFATGAANTTVAAKLGCTPRMVSKWRTRSIEAGIAGLFDEPRVGRLGGIGDELVEKIIVDTLESTPPGTVTRWSTREIATHAWVSQSTVLRIWCTCGLTRHLAQTRKLTSDPQCVEMSRNVLERV